MPVPIYIALKVHAVTRSKNLIDALFGLGLCISYDRLLKLTADIANGVCQRFEIDGIVCPPKMRHGLFTTAAVDNIDYNPSSTTSHDSFHGTGISLVQHCSPGFIGEDRGVVVINQATSSRAVAPLPSKYTDIPPATIKTKQFTTVPSENGPMMPSNLQTVTQAS